MFVPYLIFIGFLRFLLYNIIMEKNNIQHTSLDLIELRHNSGALIKIIKMPDLFIKTEKNKLLENHEEMMAQNFIRETIFINKTRKLPPLKNIFKPNYCLYKKVKEANNDPLNYNTFSKAAKQILSNPPKIIEKSVYNQILYVYAVLRSKEGKKLINKDEDLDTILNSARGYNGKSFSDLEWQQELKNIVTIWRKWPKLIKDCSDQGEIKKMKKEYREMSRPKSLSSYKYPILLKLNELDVDLHTKIAEKFAQKMKKIVPENDVENFLLFNRPWIKNHILSLDIASGLINEDFATQIILFLKLNLPIEAWTKVYFSIGHDRRFYDRFDEKLFYNDNKYNAFSLDGEESEAIKKIDLIDGKISSNPGQNIYTKEDINEAKNVYKDLSPKQKEIISLKCKGDTDQKIGDILGISHQAVSKQLKTIGKLMKHRQINSNQLRQFLKE